MPYIAILRPDRERPVNLPWSVQYIISYKTIWLHVADLLNSYFTSNSRANKSYEDETSNYTLELV